MFMNVPSVPLEKSVKIGYFSAQLYHKEQPKMKRQQAVCSRCLQRGHRVAECQNDVTCRACSESGHKRGDPTCSGERAVNNQPIGDSLAAPQGEWSRTLPQSRTSPPMLTTIYPTFSSICAASFTEDRRTNKTGLCAKRS